MNDAPAPPLRCTCACMCNVVLKDYEIRFFTRNLDVYPRNVCGKCWDETREKS